MVCWGLLGDSANMTGIKLGEHLSVIVSNTIEAISSKNTYAYIYIHISSMAVRVVDLWLNCAKHNLWIPLVTGDDTQLWKMTTLNR